MGDKRAEGLGVAEERGLVVTDREMLKAREIGRCQCCNRLQGRVANVLVQTRGAIDPTEPLDPRRDTHFSVVPPVYGDDRVFLNPTFGGPNVVVRFNGEGRVVAIVPIDPYRRHFGQSEEIEEAQVPILRLDRTSLEFDEAMKIKEGRRR